jgi:hypothetical protein
MQLEFREEKFPFGGVHRVRFVEVDSHANPAHKLEAPQCHHEASKNGELIARSEVGD